MAGGAEERRPVGRVDGDAPHLRAIRRRRVPGLEGVRVVRLVVHPIPAGLQGDDRLHQSVLLGAARVP